MKNYFMQHTSLPDSLFSITSVGEDWLMFRRLVPQYLTKDEATAVEYIIMSTADPDRREQQLRRYNGGRLWHTISSDILPLMRRTSITVALCSGDSLHYTSDNGTTKMEAVAPMAEDSDSHTAPVTEEITTQAQTQAVSTADPLHWYLKTNIPAWAMLWTNIAAEFDCAPHWSVQLPVYYSGFNYFSSRRKFRTLAIVPEVRYWFSDSNQGWFAGVHLGMAYYNVAFGGDFRYQDHNRRTPAIGGGVNFGYRLNISSNRLWRLEFSLGAGVYRLDYDKFSNEDNGLLMGRCKKTFAGIDNAAVSLCYTFDLSKGGSR